MLYMYTCTQTSKAYIQLMAASEEAKLRTSLEEKILLIESSREQVANYDLHAPVCTVVWCA